MPQSPLEWGALANAVLGVVTLLYFLVKWKWREMFASLSLLVFAAYWYLWHGDWFFAGHPTCPILLNVIMGTMAVGNLPPPPHSRRPYPY